MFNSYLQNRQLRVKCNTEAEQGISYSSLYNVQYGTHQGSCLSPFLFLLFTNDLHKNIENCSSILFADDTTVYKGHRNLNYLKWCLETDLSNIVQWFRANKLTLNVNKTVFMFYGSNTNRDRKEIEIDGKLKKSECTIFLGLWIDENLSWKKHSTFLINKLKRNINQLTKTKNLLPKFTLKLIYHAYIHSHLNYGLGVWGGMIAKDTINKLQKIQNICLKVIGK